MPFFRPYPKLSLHEKQLLLEMKEAQQHMRQSVVLRPVQQEITTVAGCDSAFIGENILSVFVVLSYPDLSELEVQYAVSPVTLPYIPGYLAFREIPNLRKAYEKLQLKPDIVMVDGHGIMHPRRLGIASHLGVVLGIPTFGVAKKRLVGVYDEPGNSKSDATFAYDKDEVIGAVIRSKVNVKSIFVSAGHLCTLNDAVRVTIQTLRSHKLPEPTRIADKYSKELKVRVSSSL